MDIPAYFQSLADDFMAGRHRSFAEAVLHPLVIYSPEDIRIEKTAQHTLEVLSQRLASARMAGATKAFSDARVGPMAESGRLPVDVTWRFLSNENTQTGQDVVRYFLRPDATGRLRIELIEVISSTLTQGSVGTASIPHVRNRH